MQESVYQQRHEIPVDEGIILDSDDVRLRRRMKKKSVLRHMQTRSSASIREFHRQVCISACSSKKLMAYTITVVHIIGKL